MNKIYVLAFLVCSLAFGSPPRSSSEPELDKKAIGLIKLLGGDLYRVGADVSKFICHVACYSYLRVPSTGTLAIDGAVDATLRQYPPVAGFLKKLEAYNPTNAAIVRDASKLATVGLKMYLNTAVDKTGRLYDAADASSQAGKFFSKVVGFAVLASFPGMDNSMSVFLINTAGDILGQTALESGESWRSRGKTHSFGAHLKGTLGNSLVSATFSVPSKAVAGYFLGETIKYFDLDQKVETGVLDVTDFVSYYVIPIYEEYVQEWGEYQYKKIGPPKRLETYSTGVHWSVNFVQSMAKSMVLTTGCKAFIDVVRSARNGPHKQLVTPILMGIGAVVGGWMLLP